MTVFVDKRRVGNQNGKLTVFILNKIKQVIEVNPSISLVNNSEDILIPENK